MWVMLSLILVFSTIFSGVSVTLLLIIFGGILVAGLSRDRHPHPWQPGKVVSEERAKEGAVHLADAADRLLPPPGPLARPGSG